MTLASYYMQSASERERTLQDAKARVDTILMSFNQAAPRSFTDEDHTEYRRRTLPLIQKHAPGYENVKIDDARGTAFDLIEKQIYAATEREAQHPTQIPEGELKQMTRHDQSGRPYYEFFGKPSTWLSTFSGGRKRLIGIRTETEQGYRPSNISDNIIGTRY